MGRYGRFKNLDILNPIKFFIYHNFMNETYNNLYATLKQTIDNDNLSVNQKLQQICEELDREIEAFDWTGFYLVDPESPNELVLGPFVGEPTEHTRIPFGTGICGQAAESKDTFIVQDVNEATNYLACSIHVQAEIVVPIMDRDRVLGEIDIDSHSRNSITEEHRNLLEQLADDLAPLLSRESG